MIPQKYKWLLCFIALSMIPAIVQAQDKRAKEFEKLIAGNDPVFVEGERVYRPKEVSQVAVVTVKPEPQYTEKARKKKAQGTVLIRAVFKSTGEVKVLNVLKRLPYGLTEQALDGASRIQFNSAVLNGQLVSQIILLQYNFNRY